MEIIDELEPVSRGPYCGAIGYLGFNRESQLSIAIRTAICREERLFQRRRGHRGGFQSGGGIWETLAKAAGFLAALKLESAKLFQHQRCARK